MSQASKFRQAYAKDKRHSTKKWKAAPPRRRNVYTCFMAHKCLQKEVEMEAIFAERGPRTRPQKTAVKQDQVSAKSSVQRGSCRKVATN